MSYTNDELFYNCAFARDVLETVNGYARRGYHCTILREDYCTKCSKRCAFFKTREQHQADLQRYGDGKDYKLKRIKRLIEKGKLWDEF